MPTILVGIVQLILPIDPANIRSIGVNVTFLISITVMLASTISPIKGLSLVRQINMLTTKATLGAWKRAYPLMHDANHFRVLSEFPIS